MNNKCLGCGAILQNFDNKNIGYTNDINSKYCERCFRIKNYNEYKIIEKNSLDFYKIIDEINKNNDLILLVVDIMSSGDELKKLVSKLNRKPLVVISKRDIFSYKVNNSKIENIIDFPCLEKISISSNKNYNMDLLLEKMNYYKNSSNVYVVGLTNSGKSTLINKIIYNYTDLDVNITTSNLPSTTLDMLEININDNLTLIDTPGIIDCGNICNYIDEKILKKISPKKEIKPITYQIKKKQFFKIEDFLIIECNDICDMTFYLSNSLTIERSFKEVNTELKKIQIDVKKNSDLVINGLGYIFINKNANFNIYTYDGVEIYIRNR